MISFYESEEGIRLVFTLTIDGKNKSLLGSTMTLVVPENTTTEFDLMVEENRTFYDMQPGDFVAKSHTAYIVYVKGLLRLRTRNFSINVRPG